MTVHRIGPDETNDIEQHTVPLGKVLVTTTDLDALFDVLRSNIYSADALANKPGPKRHKVEFDGGYFDEVSDLPTLSDGEARTLRLQGKGVQVILSPDRAVAIGDKKQAEDIYKLWARKRQTKDSPPNRSFGDRPWVIVLMLALFFTFVTMAGVSQQDHQNYQWWVTALAATAFFVGIAILVAFVYLILNLAVRYLPIRYLPNRPSYAVIVPYSLDEYRKNKSANKYPRTQTVVAIVSAIVAVLAIVATVVVAYYKP